MLSSSHIFHLPSLKNPELSGISDKSLKEKKSTDYSGFITVYHKASFICSRKLWLSIKKTFSLYLTGKIRMNRLPRVKGYWCCLLKIIQTAHLQPYRHRSTVSIPEYTCIYIQIFFKYTLVLFSIWTCAYLHICAQKKQK